MTFFEVPQPRAPHLFDTPQLRAPKIAHVVEALVDRVESTIEAIEPRLDQSEQESNQHRVEKHRNADSEVKLLIRHQDKVHSGCPYSLPRRPGLLVRR